MLSPLRKRKRKRKDVQRPTKSQTAVFRRPTAAQYADNMQVSAVSIDTRKRKRKAVQRPTKSQTEVFHRSTAAQPVGDMQVTNNVFIDIPLPKRKRKRKRKRKDVQQPTKSQTKVFSRPTAAQYVDDMQVSDNVSIGITPPPPPLPVVRSTLPVGFRHAAAAAAPISEKSVVEESVSQQLTAEDQGGQVAYDEKLTMLLDGRLWSITMSNTVTVSSTQARIPLMRLAQLKRYKYNAKHVSAVNIPSNVPKNVIMCYGPGKVICLGAEYDAVPEFAIHAAVYHMRKDLGIDLVPIYLHLHNITCVIKPVLDDGAVYPIEIDLKKFAKHPDFVSRVRYPKNFQAALFRIDTRSFGVCAHTHTHTHTHTQREREGAIHTRAHAHTHTHTHTHTERERGQFTHARTHTHTHTQRERGGNSHTRARTQTGIWTD
jgi:TATA-box binding protein (TBP) (component of TFIID and TFIIIB)